MSNMDGEITKRTKPGLVPKVLIYTARL